MSTTVRTEDDGMVLSTCGRVADDTHTQANGRTDGRMERRRLEGCVGIIDATAARAFVLNAYDCGVNVSVCLYTYMLRRLGMRVFGVRSPRPHNANMRAFTLIIECTIKMIFQHCQNGQRNGHMYSQSRKHTCPHSWQRVEQRRRPYESIIN